MFDPNQLWFFEESLTEEQLPELVVRPKKLTNERRKMVQWAESLDNKVGMFDLNVKRSMIEDPFGVSVMPIFPHFIGAPEELVLKEIMAHLEN